MSTLKTGQLVVFQGQGVVQLDGHTEKDGRQYVRLKHPAMVMYLPAENLDKAVRQPILRTQAQTLLLGLRKSDDRWDSRHFAFRYRDISRSLAKGSLEQQAEALRSLYASPFKPSFGERKLMAALEAAVLGEIVLATSAPDTLDQLVKRRDALAEELRTAQPAFAASAKDKAPEPPLEPVRPPDPFKLADVEYLGSFTVASGKIAAGDPALVGRADPGSADRASFVELEAVKGKWHAYVRSNDDGVAMLFAFADPLHTEGEASQPTRKQVGRLWVDSGQMSILDGAARSDEDTRDATQFPLFQETLVLDRGCMSRSGFGDGNYPVFAASRQGCISWIGVDFQNEADGQPTSTRRFMERVEKQIARR